MLRMLALSSTLFSILLMAPMIYVVVVRFRSVKRTTRHYTAKSCEIVIVSLYIIVQVVSYVSLETYAGGVDMKTKMYDAVWPAIRLLVFGKWLQLLLKTDDDDWFNKRRKELKHWLKTNRPKPIRVRA
jgi:hypothetical protein